MFLRNILQKSKYLKRICVERRKVFERYCYSRGNDFETQNEKLERMVRKGITETDLDKIIPENPSDSDELPPLDFSERPQEIDKAKMTQHQRNIHDEKAKYYFDRILNEGLPLFKEIIKKTEEICDEMKSTNYVDLADIQSIEREIYIEIISTGKILTVIKNYKTDYAQADYEHNAEIFEEIYFNFRKILNRVKALFIKTCFIAFPVHFNYVASNIVDTSILYIRKIMKNTKIIGTPTPRTGKTILNEILEAFLKIARVHREFPQKVDILQMRAKSIISYEDYELLLKKLVSSGPVLHLLYEEFKKFRKLYWEIRFSNFLPQIQFFELETKLSRILDQRNIATAKWHMRRKWLGKEMARSLAQKEGVPLRSIKIEMDFEISIAMIIRYESSVFHADKSNSLSKDLSLSHFARSQKPSSASEEEFIMELLIDDAYPCQGNRKNEFDQTLFLDLAEVCQVDNPLPSKPFFEFLGLKMVCGDLIGKATNFDREPVKSDIHPPYDHAGSQPSRTHTSEYVVTLALGVEDENHLKKLIESWAKKNQFFNRKLLKKVRDLRLVDFDVPRNLTDFKWHDFAMSAEADLYPWLTEEHKKYMGLDNESRYKDDPVPLVEDDAFAEYWRDIGAVMTIEESALCEVLLESSNKHALRKGEETLMKHVKSVFCYKKEVPVDRRKFTILKSTHLHGKHKDHIEEVVTRFKYVLVVPMSQRFRLRIACDDAISCGCAATLSWKEQPSE